MAVLIFLLQFLAAVIFLPLHILSYLGLWDPFVKKLFPHFLTRFTESYNKLMDDEKRKLFKNMSDFSGPSKELRLLELGCGTGANFKHYPSGCKVTCLDINPNFQNFLSESQAKNEHLIYESFVVASADNMTSVADSSMDVVVCTLLACSVPNIPAVLKEVKRVLRKKVLNSSWKLIFDGCSIRRTTWKDLENAKFSEMNLRHINAPVPMKLIRPHIIGYAVK
ncbi:N6-adenosine-methyltransferase TMT1A-like isoform X2 [Hyla sarda]|uniref:N6-adenosine-methyltransferase TMT1A-like isoform X2 n=1 Tax=Hyla sarda TaxID=327740 RepID=UPI0024C3F19E|nr:N6-adenosine-methyltransferase TMT1A-like isoform X2 [Hyla sarda]